MSIIMDHLRELLGKELVVVCLDGGTYRGRLEKYDEEALVMQEVLELNPKDLRWIEPQVSPQADGDIASQVDAYGNIDTRRLRVSLRYVIIRLESVSRIWPWLPVDSGFMEVKRYRI